MSANAPVNPPRGMRDFLPAEKAVRESTLAVIRREFARFGYQEIETPAIEELDRLVGEHGGENEKLIFRILKRNLEEGASESQGLADLGLRFDLTVPLSRFYATHRAKLPDVFRSIQIGPVWRAERPQKGRFRQFTQCDLDILGEPSVIAEIELVTATLHTLFALGIADTTVRLNDRRILTALLRHCGFPAEEWGRTLIALDKLDKVGIAGVRAELEARGHAAEAISRLVDAMEPLAAGSMDLAGLSAFAGRFGVSEELVANLSTIAAGIEGTSVPGRVAFDPSLVRGMGYYTGPIFEVHHPAGAGSIAGGGRYDGMIGRFAGSDTPACGFSIGFERIIELARLEAPGATRRIALVYASEVPPARVVKLQYELASQGHVVRIVARPKKLAKTLERLLESGYGEFAFVEAGTTSIAELAFKPIR